jgi:tRNA threonylcarbamoyladenosine biosynthesis protein TsaB
MRICCETIRRSVSVCIDDGAVRDLRPGGEAERDAAALLTDLVRDHGRPAAFAMAVGPGSFTGLRVGLVAVRTLAWLHAVPVVPVDSLTAIACAAGPGLWLPLLPLKRDTTFAALVRVHADGRPEILAPTAALLDAGPGLVVPADAVVIGPALEEKPGLAAHWAPGAAQRPGVPVDATGVALAARWVEPVPWAQVLPAYHLEPGPVLQRRLRDQASSSAV